MGGHRDNASCAGRPCRLSPALTLSQRAPSCSSTAQLGMGPVIVDLKLTDIARDRVAIGVRFGLREVAGCAGLTREDGGFGAECGDPLVPQQGVP